MQDELGGDGHFELTASVGRGGPAKVMTRKNNISAWRIYAR